MTAVGQIYKCNICGNIVSVRHAGKGQLVCCQKPMEVLEERSADQGYEKHLPVITGDGEVTVTVGSIPHPMTENHYIEWIEVYDSDGTSHLKYLAPSDPPEARFKIPGKARAARAFCNLHGLWKAEVE